MIILNENMGVEIPNYDDLDNKPKINGVTLEGDLTSEELGIDTSDFYTKSQSDDRFQLKGNYLTSVPSEYVTENELNNTLNQKDYATKTYVNTTLEEELISLNLVSMEWIEEQGYLTSIPSEYVTETELNDAINKLDIGIQSISVDDGRAYLTATTTNNNVELDLTIGSLTHHVSGVLDAQMTDEYLSETFYTKTEIDSQMGDINTILENIIG